MFQDALTRTLLGRPPSSLDSHEDEYKPEEKLQPCEHVMRTRTRCTAAATSHADDAAQISGRRHHAIGSRRRRAVDRLLCRLQPCGVRVHTQLSRKRPVRTRGSESNNILLLIFVFSDRAGGKGKTRRQFSFSWFSFSYFNFVHRPDGSYIYGTSL